MAAIAHKELRTAVIRTSDRQLFKRCRRKWSWQSGLTRNRNLELVDTPSYFWLGTGGHFALEDFHGYNHYQHPVEAFKAYVSANIEYCRRSRKNMPDDYKEQVEMGEGILDNYLNWLKTREHYPTLWLDGEPQVEVRCLLKLEMDRFPQAIQDAYDEIYYQATLDRMITKEDELWIQDWKFFKTFSTGSLDFDSQMSAYIWMAATIYKQPVVGACLHQFRKALPVEPKILGNGKISTAKNQTTTRWMYKQALIGMYGEMENVPHGNVICLNDLAAQESFDRDKFIKRDFTRRTEMQQQAEGTKIILEISDMLNPEISLYPNYTRDCDWDCQLSDVCLMMDRDDDWESQLDDLTINRGESDEGWRSHLN